MATTTCTTCGKLYEESSEELANAPERDCMDCWMAKRTEENLRSTYWKLRRAPTLGKPRS